MLRIKRKIIEENFRLFTVGTLVSVLATIAEVFSIGAIVPIVASVVQNNPLSLGNGFFIDSLTTIIQKIPSENLMISVFVFFLLINVFRIFLSFLEEYFKVSISQKIRVDCQKWLFEKYLYADKRFFYDEKKSNLLYNITTLSSEISSYFTILPAIFIDLLSLVSILALLISVSGAVLVLSFVVVFFVVLAMVLTVKESLKRNGRIIIETGSNQTMAINEMLGGHNSIFHFKKQKDWNLYFSDLSDRFYKLKMRTASVKLLPSKVLEGILVCILCGVGIYLSLGSTNKIQEHLPLFTLMLLALARLLPVITRLIQSFGQINTYKPALEIMDKAYYQTSNWRTDGSSQINSLTKDILFKSVRFSFNEGQPVLNDVSFSIPSSKITAIVGGSGSGKSTCLSLLLGEEKAKSGEILLENFSINDIVLNSFLDFVTYVPQSPFIFNMSIKDNILMTRNQSEGDLSRLTQVIEVCCLQDVLADLPQGINTVIGDQGIKLSGGQKQRIALARSIYKECEILIMDEATSALDNLTETKVLSNVFDFFSGKTIVVLAHRLQAISKADQIVVLDSGFVKEVGSHKELIEMKGLYYKQFSNV